MSVFRYEKDEHCIVTVTMDMTGPVNAMNDEYLLAMEGTLQRLENEPDLRGVVLASAKKTFFAGGDIRDMINASLNQYDAFHQRLVTTKAQLRRLELLPVPVVAAINGAALGGGFEICLVCNRRIVFDVPKAVVGLPEITLGLLPGGGGTVRLIRLLGISRALPLLLQGRPHLPQQALALGLIDQCVETEDALLAQAKAWILSPAAVSRQPWQEDGYVVPDGDAGAPAVAAFLQQCRCETLKATRDLLPAPGHLVDLAGRSTLLSLDAALDLESEIAARLTLSSQAKNIMTTRFHQMNLVRRSMQGRGKEAIAQVRRIGIAGLGDDAIACARAQALGVAALASGIQVACGSVRERTLLLQAATEHPRIPADIVLEEMIELVDTQEKAKKSPACDVIFDFPTGPATLVNQLRHVLAGHGACVAVNAVQDVAGNAAFPRFRAFLHVKDASLAMVELAPGSGDSKVRIPVLMEFFYRIGVIAIIVNDVEHGFVARVSSAYEDERRRLLEEGIAEDDIDRQAWALGMNGNVRKPAVGAEADSLDATTKNDIKDRLLFRQVLATLACLEQGVVASVADANVATFLAADAPTWAGGYLQLINTYDINAFVARTSVLAERYGPRFSPPDLLLAHLKNRTGFH